MMRNRSPLAVIALLIAFSVNAADQDKSRTLVDNADKTLQTFLAHENMKWLRDHIKEVHGIMIIPRMITAGFVIAASGGDAVLLSRDTKTGKWSDPAFYKVGGFSVGFQAGGEAAKTVVLVRSDKALHSLMKTSGKFGASGSIAAGPVGGGAATNVTADMVSYTLTKGAFAGVSLAGNVVEPYTEFNQQYYGKEVTPEEILIKNSVSDPASKALKSTLAKAAR